MRISDWSSDVCSSDLERHRYRISLVENAAEAAAQKAAHLNCPGDIGKAIDRNIIDIVTAGNITCADTAYPGAAAAQLQKIGLQRQPLPAVTHIADAIGGKSER